MGTDTRAQYTFYNLHGTDYRIQITKPKQEGQSHSPKMYIQDMSLVFPLGGEVLPTVFTGVGLVAEND